MLVVYSFAVADSDLRMFFLICGCFFSYAVMFSDLPFFFSFPFAFSLCLGFALPGYGTSSHDLSNN